MKILPTLIACLFAAALAFNTPARALSPAPNLTDDPAQVASGAYAATVHGDLTNVRAEPSLNSEVLATLEKGDRVTVLGEVEDKKAKGDEPRRWSRIALPAKVPVWIYSGLIDPTNRTVKAAKVNLRAGPGKNFSELGELKKGDKVTEIRASDGWLQIEPPATAVAYVASSLLTKGAAVPSPAAAAAAAAAAAVKPAVKSPEKPTAPANVASRPSRLPERAPESRPPAPGRTAPAEQRPDRAPIVQNPPPAQPAAQDLPPAEPAPAPAPEPAAATPVAPVVITPIPASPASTTPAQPEIVYPTETREPRRVVREGVVTRALAAHAPALYQLSSFRRGEGVLDYLYSEDPKIDLEKFRGQRVFVTGEESIDPVTPRTPVLKIIEIRTGY